MVDYRIEGPAMKKFNNRKQINNTFFLLKERIQENDIHLPEHPEQEANLNLSENCKCHSCQIKKKPEFSLHILHYCLKWFI